MAKEARQNGDTAKAAEYM